MYMWEALFFLKQSGSQRILVLTISKDIYLFIFW